MTKRDLPEQTRSELISGMVVANQRLKSLVFNFLEGARLSTSRNQYSFSVVSAPQLIATYVANHEVFFKNVAISIHAEEDHIPISVDADASRCLLEPVENAMHSPRRPPGRHQL
jgi:K+-sensing histidine kinase KdpD